MLKVWFQRLATTLFAVLYMLACFYAFGDSENHDKLIIATLGLSLMVSIGNVNLVSISLILLLVWTFSFVSWYVFTDTLLGKTLAYLTCAALLWQFKFDPLRKPLAWGLVAFLGLECYWYSVGYPAPQAFWDLYLVAISYCTRNLFSFRTVYLRLWFSRYSENAISTPADAWFKLIFTMQMMIHIFSAVEYVVRHLWLPNLLVVYNLTTGYLILLHMCFALLLATIVFDYHSKRFLSL